MLKATQAISSAINSGNDLPFSGTLIDIICKHGTLADVQELYPLFIESKNEELLAPIMYLGDEQIADDLFKKVINDGKVGHYPPQVLEVLSYMQQKDTLPVLMDYYDDVFNLDWSLHESVCTALMNYDCSGYEQRISAQIEQCLNKYLFPDLITLPAVKTRDASLAHRFYEHGNNTASTSCCGGMIFAIASFGKQNLELFKSIIFNESWEAAYSSIGNLYYTVMGMHILGISLRELYYDLLTIMQRDGYDARYELYVYKDILKAKINEPLFYPIRSVVKQNESFNDIYFELFDWRGAGKKIIYDHIQEYCNKKQLKDEFSDKYQFLENLYQLKMEQEAEEQYMFKVR